MISGGDPITAIVMGILGAVSTAFGAAKGGPLGGLLGMLGPATAGILSGVGPAATAASTGSMLGETTAAAAPNFMEAASGAPLTFEAASSAPSLVPGGIGFTLDPALAAAGSGLPGVGLGATQTVSSLPTSVGSPNISNITQPGYNPMSAPIPSATQPAQPGMFSKIGGWLNPTADVAGKSPMEAIMAMQHASRQATMRQGLLSGGLSALASVGSDLLKDKPYEADKSYGPDKVEYLRERRKQMLPNAISSQPSARDILARIRSRRTIA